MNEQNYQQLYQQQLREAITLAEGPWSPLCKPLIEKGKLEAAALVARLCQNEHTFLERGITEDVRVHNTGTFHRFVFPMIRAVWANLISTELFSVQPMTGPSAQIFYLDTLYGATKGAITKGSVSESAVRGHEPVAGYPSEWVRGEAIALGTAAAGETALSGTVAWTPVRPGTVTVVDTTDGTTVSVVDDGDGGLSGTGISAGTINYATGAWSLTLSADLATGMVLAIDYRYVMEGNLQRPQLDINITNRIVRADTWSLTTNWSVESEQDLRMVHGIEADATLLAKVAEHLRFEIDRDNIAEAEANAIANGLVTWDYTPPAGVDFYRHQLTLVNTLVDASNAVFSLTRGRATPNWIVAGTKFATVIETHPSFQKMDSGAQKGVVHCGRFLDWEVYKDPWMAQTKALMGYKGTDWTEAGLVYAPYIPLWRSPSITLSDMVRRVGMMSRFARVLVNNDYYVPLEVLNYGAMS